VSTEPDATVLAFDFGTRRVGVAIGNTLTRTAHPLQTIDAADAGVRSASIDALIDEWRPARLVVGLPVHADGAEHAMTARARNFARELERRLILPVALVDERYTSELARQALAASGRGGRSRRGLTDQVAAQMILQAWFDERHDA
jgi:putative holliday junction resolvase